MTQGDRIVELTRSSSTSQWSLLPSACSLNRRGDIPTAWALTAFRAEAKSSGAVSAAVAKPLVRDALRAVRASIACLYIVIVDG
jgi:hypothetical protein